MAVTVDSFRGLFPEFASVSSTEISAWLTVAARYVGTIAWSTKADDGVHWLTAHLLKLAGSSDGSLAPGGSEVLRNKVGDVDVQYAISLTDVKGFSSTTYGRGFMALASTVFAPRCL